MLLTAAAVPGVLGPNRAGLRGIGSLQQSSGRARGSRGPLCPRASNSEDGDRDWDKAWSDFKRNVGASMPEVESRVTTEAPRFAKRRDWNAGQRQEALKQQERFLLNYWSQDSFFKSGGALVIAFFVIMVLLAGPPPSDGRCTLPWC